MTGSISGNLGPLSTGKKTTSSLTFSLRYCKDIANLLFQLLWACLGTHTQSEIINLQKAFVFICRQKFNFIPHAFLEILQRYTNFLQQLNYTLIPFSSSIFSPNDSINAKSYKHLKNLEPLSLKVSRMPLALFKSKYTVQLSPCIVLTRI